MEKLFCGIDVGTQGARCLLVDADGRRAAGGECPFPSAAMNSGPDGAFEQEPGGWVAAIRDALRQCLEGVETRRIRALSVTSTSGTLCALDARHRPVVPAIMYNDRRSSEEAELVQSAGAELAQRLGFRFSSSFGLPKILWLKRRRPGAYRRARSFLSPTDCIIGWLTDNWERSDQTNMLKFGYDLRAERWPEFIEDELGIPRGRLPEVGRSGTPAGRLTSERAGQLGLSDGIPVASGATDGCASLLASGAVAPGQYNTTIGTTLVIKGVSKKLLLDPLGRIYCHRHPADRTPPWWLPGGASNTGAECLAKEFSPDEVEGLGARALDESPTGLVAYPLVGRGERFPFHSSEAEGFLSGAPQSRGERFAALLEGVACLERLAYETLEELGARIGDRIFSTGGGSRSDAWLQIRADTLNRTVVRPAVTGAAMGAAALAASMEHYGDIPAAVKAMVRPEIQVEPRVDMLDAYAHKYAELKEQLRARGFIPAP